MRCSASCSSQNGTPMVDGPSYTPPGYIGRESAGAVWWCARHERWVTRGLDGQYWCPGGHRLEHNEASDEAMNNDES